MIDTTLADVTLCVLVLLMLFVFALAYFVIKDMNKSTRRDIVDSDIHTPVKSTTTILLSGDYEIRLIATVSSIEISGENIKIEYLSQDTPE